MQSLAVHDSLRQPHSAGFSCRGTIGSNPSPFSGESLSRRGLWTQRKNRFATDSPLKEDGFEPSVPPPKRRPWGGGPRPTTVVAGDDLCLMTHPAYRSGISVRQQPRDPFCESGTEGSNPVSSSGESANFRSLARCRDRMPYPRSHIEAIDREGGKMSDEDCYAVAEFIRSRGITRCPTACVLPTQGLITAADRIALEQYGVARDRVRQERAAIRWRFLTLTGLQEPR